MSFVKSFDDKSIYEDVLPHAVFEMPQYVDTDIAVLASLPKCVRGKIYPGANNPEELRTGFQEGDTHADLTSFDFYHDVEQFEAHGYNGLKAGLNRRYGKEECPEA